MDRTPYLTAVEVARLLRVHPQSVYKMVRDGELTAVHIGRHIRIPCSTLLEHGISEADLTQVG